MQRRTDVHLHVSHQPTTHPLAEVGRLCPPGLAFLSADFRTFGTQLPRALGDIAQRPGTAFAGKFAAAGQNDCVLIFDNTSNVRRRQSNLRSAPPTQWPCTYLLLPHRQPPGYVLERLDHMAQSLRPKLAPSASTDTDASSRRAADQRLKTKQLASRGRGRGRGSRGRGKAASLGSHLDRPAPAPRKHSTPLIPDVVPSPLPWCLGATNVSQSLEPILQKRKRARLKILPHVHRFNEFLAEKATCNGLL